MKKIYLQLSAIVALLALSGSMFAQTITFTQAVSSNWNNASNWSSGVVPNGNDANTSIVIPAGKSAAIFNVTIILTGVKIFVNGALTIGTGNGSGANSGALTLDNASTINLGYDGTNRGSLSSNSTGNNSNIVTIGGVTKFQGGDTYSLNTGSSTGVITGPAHANASTGNTAATSFALGSLPVLLSGFGANLANGGKVNVSWTTEQELNSDHFELQRSSDGLNWQALATVKASGFSSVPKSYTYSDAAPQQGTNLYRLKMVDVDAAYHLSGVVNVRLAMMGRISLYPNPVVNVINISLGEAPSTSWKVSLYNTAGQAIVQKTFSKDQTTVSLPVSNYPWGHYTVEITDGVSRQSATLLIAHQ